MLRSTPSRRLPALLAAYLIALQAMLLPVTVLAAVPFGGAQCQAANPSGGDTGNGCPCAAACGMLCCVQALAAPPQPEFAPVRHAVTSFRAPAVRDAVIIISAEDFPHGARAPPVV